MENIKNKKNIKLLVSMMAFALIFVFSSLVNSFQTKISIPNNQKKVLEYKPSEYRRMYAFHDYGSVVPFDDAKFHGEAYGFDRNYVYMQYKNAIGDSKYVYKIDEQFNGKKESRTSEAKYDFFKTDSYLKVEGGSNQYKITIK